MLHTGSVPARAGPWIGGLGVAAAVAVVVLLLLRPVGRSEGDDNRTGGVGAARPPCESAEVVVAYEGGGAASNHTVDYFSLRNTGNTCQLRGYPHVELIGEDGRPLEQAATPGGSYATRDAPVRTIGLATNDKAWFAVGSQSICGEEGHLAPMASALAIRLPGSSTSLTVERAVPYCPTTAEVSVTSLQAAQADIAPSGPQNSLRANTGPAT